MIQSILNLNRVFVQPNIIKLNFAAANSFSTQHVTAKLFNDVQEPRDLFNFEKIQKILAFRVPGRSMRSLQGLLHGKNPKTGKKTCFSQKKTIRWWKPNIVKKQIFSHLLNRTLCLKLSTTTLKEIRKYGGFDSYVLLCPPKSLDSIYGEYLRKAMMLKLNNPSCSIPYILKSHHLNSSFHQVKSAFEQEPDVVLHPSMKNQDISMHQVRLPHEMGIKEFQRYRKIEELVRSQTDIPPDHPLVKDIVEEQNRDKEKLEPMRQKVLETYRNMKSKKFKEKIEQAILDSKQEMKNLTKLSKKEL